MLLITGFYEDPDPRRCGELLECVRRNAANPRIAAIHLFVEEPRDPAALLAAYPPLADPKVRLVAHGRRVTYQDLFSYANRELGGRRVIIANADIYFDQSLARLDGYDLSGKLLCLSRWDVQPDGSARFFEQPASQDAWIFHAPIRPFPCAFFLGVLGCDNRLAWEAAQAGLALANPGRSLRAYHLHLSQIRRYNQHQWLPGPTRSTPASFLDTPWLWFVVPCMGRMGDVQQTIASLLGQPRSSYVLVDYACPDRAGAWARAQHPDITVVTVAGRTTFSGAEARNQGAAAVDGDGMICFLDADVAAAPGLAEALLARLDVGTFLVPDRQGPGLDNTIVCRKADFERVGGFDEVFLDWGEECADLRTALSHAGLTARTFPADLLSPIEPRYRGDSALRVIKDRRLAGVIHTAYRQVKAGILDATSGRSLSRRCLREIYAAIVGQQLAQDGSGPDPSCASVAFRERMGYVIARLAVGISSHTNDHRPFTDIPAVLTGLAFTQVVASVVSPVEVEFLTPGRLYVLVGNDWDGYYTATTWLRENGKREQLPLVATRRGTGFEAWSLIGESGERLVIPTQVMLAASRLVRM